MASEKIIFPPIYVLQEHGVFQQDHGRDHGKTRLSKSNIWK